MDIALLIDFGSTYTKVTAIDLDSEELLARTQAPTTVGSDIMIGLNDGLRKLESATGLKGSDGNASCLQQRAAGGLRWLPSAWCPS